MLNVKWRMVNGGMGIVNLKSSIGYWDVVFVFHIINGVGGGEE